MITNEMAITSSNEQDVINANLQIAQNAGIPNEYTDKWDDVKQVYGQNLFYILAPKPEGWKPGEITYTYTELMQNVTNITLQNYDTDWQPPSPQPRV